MTLKIIHEWWFGEWQAIREHISNSVLIKWYIFSYKTISHRSQVLLEITLICWLLQKCVVGTELHMYVLYYIYHGYYELTYLNKQFV
jgi:hypothetical protein